MKEDLTIEQQIIDYLARIIKVILAEKRAFRALRAFNESSHFPRRGKP